MSETKDLSSIIVTGFFRVPDYQRGYSWGNRQLSELWDDLADMPVDGMHYTGALYVEEIPKSERPTAESWIEEQGTVYSVVDGQQRMTTLILLLSVLLQSNEVKERGLCGFSQDDLLKRYLFTTHVQTGERAFRFSCGKPESNLRRLFEGLCSVPSITPIDAEKRKISASSRYERNLVDAKLFFSEKIGGLTFDEKSDLFKKVTKGLFFDFRPIGDKFNPQVVFETMNNRGKPLTILEKLKNRLMFLSSVIGLDEDMQVLLRERINAAWGRIYYELAKDAELQLDEDEFLRAHLSLYRNPTENTYSKAVAESRLFKMFSRHPERYPVSEDGGEQSEKETALTYEKIADYVEDLSGFAETWWEIHADSGGNFGRCRVLSGSMETRILLAAIKKRIVWEYASGILGKLECLLFRSTIKKIDDGLFATWARSLYGKVASTSVSRKEQPVTVESFEARLDQELTETLIPDQELVDFFKKLFDYKRGNCGYFRWSGLKYFLFKMEEEYATRGAMLRINWKNFHEASIEHIIPQSAADKPEASWWKREIEEAIPDGVNASEAETFRKILVNSLGNLILLGSAENASVSNNPWEDYTEVGVEGKKKRYQGGTMSLGAVAVAQKYCNEDSRSWNAFKIRQRGQNLLKKLLEMLGLEFSLSEKQELDMLGFENLKLTEDTIFPLLTPEEYNQLPKSRTMKKRNNDADTVISESDSQIVHIIEDVFGDDLGNVFANGAGIHFQTKTMNEFFPPNITSDKYGFYRFYVSRDGQVGLQFHPGKGDEGNDDESCRNAIKEALLNNHPEVWSNLNAFPSAQSTFIGENKHAKKGVFVNEFTWTFPKGVTSSEAISLLLKRLHDWELELKEQATGTSINSLPADTYTQP